MDLDKKISAMYDSVNLIRELIDNNSHHEDVDDVVSRNVKYLEFMLDQEEIKDSGRDLEDFKNIVQEGLQFIS